MVVYMHGHYHLCPSCTVLIYVICDSHDLTICEIVNKVRQSVIRFQLLNISFIASSFTKCGSSNSILLASSENGDQKKFACNLSAEDFSSHFTLHFFYLGWQNPYGKKERAVWHHSASPIIGRTYLHAKDNYIRILTNIGEGKDIIEDFIYKE